MLRTGLTLRLRRQHQHSTGSEVELKEKPHQAGAAFVFLL